MDDTHAGPALEFTNAPIEPGDLPMLATQAFTPVDPAYSRMHDAIATAAAAVVGVIAVASGAFSASWVPVVLGAVVFGVIALVARVARIAVAHLGYLIREHDLSLRSGVISRSVATAPFARVQHVSIGRGPIERRFGLSTLQLRTAGGHIALRGLPDDVAERLKELVAERAAILAEAEIEAEAGVDAGRSGPTAP